MKLSIVSLSFNKKEMTGDYVASLYVKYTNEFEKNDLELLIVDNASPDGAAEYLKTYIKKNNYKNVFLIENKENVGFGEGCNQGAKNARGDFLLFLNNDSQIHGEEKEFFRMLDYMDKHLNIAVMGGRMKNIDGTPQLSAWKFYTLGNALLMLFGLERFGILSSSPSIISKTDWVTGGCMMVNKRVFNDLNGFDKHFFMYMEDMEFCYRVKKAGYEVYYYPNTNISHIGQGSSNRTFAVVSIYKGILYFYKKHMSAWEYGIIKFCLYTKAKLLVIFGKMSRQPYFTNTYEQALKVF